MARWLKGPKDEKILLSGVLAKRVFSAQEEQFLIKLASAQDEDRIQNIAVGVAVAPRPGAAATPARTVTCFHCTIPRTNFTAFYRRLSTFQIVLIGVGEHRGTTNKKYAVDWADGSSVAIDLDKTGTGADFLSEPKRLDEEGRLVLA
jgi:hypothetical protein